MRKLLIHLLGGSTDAEMKESNRSSFDLGVYHGITMVKVQMDRQNGQQADEWCSNAYEYVTDKLDELLDKQK